MRKIRRILAVKLCMLFLVLSTAFAIPAMAGTVNLSAASIDNGETVTWYPTSEDGWDIYSGTSVTIHIKLTTSESSVYYGLKNMDTGTKNCFAKFDDSKKSTTTKTITSAGTYRVYVTNVSAGTIRVTHSSYISF